MAHFPNSDDVSRHERVEKALQESEERFRLAMEVTSDGLWDWDVEAGTGYFSPGCYRMLGYDPDEFVMTIPVWLDFIHPEDRDRTLKAKTDCIENRTDSFVATFRMKHKSGHCVWVLGRGKVVRRDAGGKAQRMLGTHVDITERKESEQKLQQLNDELEKRVLERTSELEGSLKEMESFCHSVSHELRAPIARIEGFCNLLDECLESDDQKGVRHCAERLGHSSQRIRAVIDALLSMHRLGRADMHIEPVNLSDIASQALDELLNREPTRRLRLSIAPDVIVQGDRRMLGICLQNLLENAVKYTGKTVQPAIEFGVVHSSGDPVYFVRDNGAGFDMAFANRLFQPFSRLHNDAEFTGSGIGLATVQRIVERHCGQIWAEASPGKGATFYFTLGDQ